MLEELEREGYYYRLSTTVNQEPILIDESQGYTDKKPITQEIRVPNHTWQLSVSPQKTWIHIGGLFIILGVGMGITVLCAIIVHMLEERNNQLKIYAEFDALTGLVNRRKLLNYMELRCRDQKVPMAILYLDINDFKKINDTYGHSQGDALLKEAASRLKQSIANEDVVARVGGDEFVIVLEHCNSAKECLSQIQALKEALARPLSLGNTTHRIQVSIGYALYPEEAVEFQELLNLADKRMYEDKRNSRQEA